MKNSLILSSKILNKRFVTICLIGIVVFGILFCVFLVHYLNNCCSTYIDFYETGNIDYKVYLEENDFFVNKYLGKDRQYIAELIDYIIADFEYKVSLENNDISYKYDYRIEIEANVVNKETRNVIFNKRQEVINRQDLEADNGIIIGQNIKIDYSYYNNLVRELINTYGLMDTAESRLLAKMYVSYNCWLGELKNDVKNNIVLTMEIPLAERTVDVSLDNDVFSLNNDFFVFTSKDNYIIYLVVSILFGLVVLYLIVVLLRYCIKVNSYISNFDKNLNKILKNYESYIQKMDGNFDFRGYKVLKVFEFESMLELRDMLSKPIMMINDETNGIIRFVITTDDIAYVYQLMK